MKESGGSARGRRARAVGTIVARNYLAQARVLCASVALHEPTATFFTLVVDGDDDDRATDGVGTVLLAEDLGLPPADVATMRLSYDVMEYATALKPALLRHLLRREAAVAAYLDPDICVFAPLDAVFDAAAEHGIALTPHALEPLPRDGRMLDESVIMHAGMYNLGFIAVGPAALRFLAWWHERLLTDAVVDLGKALFTDQRWVDWAPALERPHILRDKGLNAAYWNLHERRVSRADDGTWLVSGQPLVFFHFSGYDPAIPWLLSKHQGAAPRSLLSDNPALRELCDEYGAALTEAGHLTLRTNPYRNDLLPSGLRLTRMIRRLCRDAYAAGGTELPPDPWSDEPAFLRWLFEPTLGSGVARYSRFEDAVLRSRGDLRAAFPDPDMADGSRLRRWLDDSAEMLDLYRSVGLEGRPTRESRTEPRRRADPQGGWSVIAYARAELGVGEAGRRISRAMALSGVPWEMVGLSDGPLSRQAHRYRGDLAAAPSFANHLMCVNADQTPRVAAALRPETSGLRIGYWFWELAQFPERLTHALAHVDEVWVSSEFNRAAVAAVADRPVRLVPLPVGLTEPGRHFTREQLGVPVDRTVFLVNFDYLSVMRRKNPIGAIEAFKRAFEPGDGATLLMKSINGHLRLADREQVRLAAQGRPDILVREDYLTAAELRGLTQVVDCVVSLHRSEGYGLNLADAMSVGTPVIATAYSGNMQFMDEESSFLVPFELSEVGPGAAPYDATAVWAEPDLDAAAALMRTVLTEPVRVNRVVERARDRLAAFDPRVIGAQIRDLLVPDSMRG